MHDHHTLRDLPSTHELKGFSFLRLLSPCHLCLYAAKCLGQFKCKLLGWIACVTGVRAWAVQLWLLCWPRRKPGTLARVPRAPLKEGTERRKGPALDCTIENREVRLFKGVTLPGVFHTTTTACDQARRAQLFGHRWDHTCAPNAQYRPWPVIMRTGQGTELWRHTASLVTTSAPSRQYV